MEIQRALPAIGSKLSRSSVFLLLVVGDVTDHLQTIVSTTPLYSLYDEAIFPSPTTYNPARWLVVDNDQKREMLSHFHPFSRGKRQCIGQK